MNGFDNKLPVCQYSFRYFILTRTDLQFTILNRGPTHFIAISNLELKLILLKMDVEYFLKMCGDFNRYQFLMLGLFAVINVLSSIHYFSQTIISFIPDHW